ncbi:MAG: J domain-containing protein [Thermodesulfobacteriota bacterium]
MSGPFLGADILNACKLMFPTAGIIDAGFLTALAEEDLKTAFRKNALKTHPDRSSALGRSPEELTRLFQELTFAYQALQTFRLRGATDRVTPRTHQRPRPQWSSARVRRPVMNDFYHQGILPQRQLRLGEYLYYSKVISWRTLIGAIVWQKRQRPLFGEIARQWNFLSDEQIRLILKIKKRGEMFGECARRNGLLSHFQQLAVTGRQRRMQPLFGRHFIENGLMSLIQINLMVGRMEQHNRRLRYH